MSSVYMNYKKTNGGPMKILLLDFLGYEMTIGGPMKRPYLDVLRYEKDLSSTHEKTTARL